MSYTIDIPVRLIGKLTFKFLTNITDAELNLFNNAFIAIGKYMDEYNIIDERQINIMFLPSNQLHIELSEVNCGEYMCLVIYHMEIIRECNDTLEMFAIFLEELIHCYLDIIDEIAVKYKVIELSQLVSIQIKKEDYLRWGIQL